MNLIDYPDSENYAFVVTAIKSDTTLKILKFFNYDNKLAVVFDNFDVELVAKIEESDREYLDKDDNSNYCFISPEHYLKSFQDEAKTKLLNELELERYKTDTFEERKQRRLDLLEGIVKLIKERV